MKEKYFFRKMIFFGLLVAGLSGCKTEYDPPLKPLQSNVLVVEGFIDGAAPTTITLSHSRRITNGDTATVKHELGARVIVEDDKQNRFYLQEMGAGVYSSQNILTLNPLNKYHLRIETGDHKEYISDFVSYKQSPPIDSVGWYLKDDGVQLYANTHDDRKESKYYRWKFVETWEFHSSYNSELKYISETNAIVPRTVQVYICWNSHSSNSVVIGSSTKLTDDVIFRQPLIFIEPHSEKMRVLYSILVTQYTMDINAFNYWEAMRNNTEKIGSIFDPQPNQTTGNIHSTSIPSEIVVGFIGAGSSVQKRVFVKNKDLPPDWNLLNNCEIKKIKRDSTKYYFNRGYEPIYLEIDLIFGDAYHSSKSYCIDCTLWGSNVKPDFWP